MSRVDGLAPVLTMSHREYQRLIAVGRGFIRVQNDVVAMIVPVEPLPFRRGATAPEIVAEWEKQRGKTSD